MTAAELRRAVRDPHRRVGHDGSCDVFTAAAKLTDPDGGAPIAGKPVTFTLGVGDSCTATTTVAGLASCTITPHQSGNAQPGCIVRGRCLLPGER